MCLWVSFDLCRMGTRPTYKMGGLYGVLGLRDRTTSIVNSLFTKDEATGKLVITTDAPMFTEKRQRIDASFDEKSHEGITGCFFEFGPSI